MSDATPIETIDLELAAGAMPQERFQRRFRIFLQAVPLVYLVGAFFGQKFYILIASLLGAYGGKEWLSSRGPLPVRVRLRLPRQVPAGSKIPVAIEVSSPVALHNVEVQLDMELPGERMGPGAVFHDLPAVDPLSHVVELPPLPRGCYPITGLEVGSAGEMGLIERSVTDVLTETLYVHPAPVSPSRQVSPPMEPSEVTTGIIPGPLSPTGITTLRPISTGDSLRRIDWRATARLGEIVVLSTRIGPPARVLLVVDDRPGPDLDRILAVAAHALLHPGSDRRRRGLVLVSAFPEGFDPDEKNPVARGLERLAGAGARAAGPGNLRTVLHRLPRYVPESEILVITAAPPQLPSIEGFPMGFLLR